MKQILKIIVCIAGTVLIAANAQAQDNVQPKVQTVTFKASGVCNMCKQRIESAALIKGVKLAQWDKDKQELKVIYKTKHTNEQSIQQAVADAGHDTEKVKASKEAYQKLPACCAYRDGVEVH